MSFWHDFLTHNDKPAGKWSHYFPAYDRHFTSWKDKSITFLEIGTASGGSMQLWRGFFGPPGMSSADKNAIAKIEAIMAR